MLILVLPDRLHARSPVDVHHRRYLLAPLRADLLGQQHEWRFSVILEDLVRPFGKNDRRERSECLPVLDPLIQFVLHLRRARVRQDAAIPESTRSEFGTALEPAEHMTLG